MDAQELKIFTAIVIVVIVLAVVITSFFISLYRSQRKLLQLHKANVVAEITAQEKERSRIATDLHDELAPLISSTKMKINSFILTDQQDLEQLEKVNGTIDETLKRMREISFDLMPASLLRKGLIAALSLYVNNLEKSSLIVKLQSTRSEIRIPEEKLINLYRVVLEIIQNTIKHAGASELLLDFKLERKKLLFTSKDNGVGFNYEKMIRETMGFSIRSLLRRVDAMGSELFIESEPGKGTSYSLEIPL